MLNKLFPARFSGMNLRFFLFFLLFAYLPLLIFSIIGFFLNKQILKQVYQQDLNRCLNVWVEKYHVMTQCDHDLFVVLAHGTPNEEAFLQKINSIPNRNNRQVVTFAEWSMASAEWAAIKTDVFETLNFGSGNPAL
jgi:hypothetical protein